MLRKEIVNLESGDIDLVMARRMRLEGANVKMESVILDPQFFFFEEITGIT